jgi:hypothetical protein
VLVAIVGFTSFIPPGSYSYGAMVVALLLLVSATFLIAALLPLEPVTGSQIRAAKRVHVFTVIALGLLALALFIKLFIRLYAGAA